MGKKKLSIARYGRETLAQVGCNKQKGVYLKLIRNNKRKGVSLVATNSAGAVMSHGYIISFNGNGTITRHKDVSKKLGFVLRESNGQVKNENDFV